MGKLEKKKIKLCELENRNPPVLENDSLSPHLSSVIKNKNCSCLKRENHADIVEWHNVGILRHKLFTICSALWVTSGKISTLKGNSAKVCPSYTICH